MSWDQQAFSFGNPNGQPPTPTQTPTSVTFPSPLFQTPRNNSGNFEARSDWIPNFAEEYSVFNATPGHLTSIRSPVGDAFTPRPSTASSQSQPFAGPSVVGPEGSLNGHQLSLSTKLDLPAIDPSLRLKSSPAHIIAASESQSQNQKKAQVTSQKVQKKIEGGASGQGPTPPQSVSRQFKSVASKSDLSAMQMDYGTETPIRDADFLSSFASNNGDFFDFPLSAPATAPVFTSTRPFWDPDTSMSGMGIDVSTDGWQASHRMSTSYDWGRSTQSFQETATASSFSSPLPPPPSKGQRPLAPKPIAPALNTNVAQAPFDFSAISAPDDPFTSLSAASAVDPGLLFGMPSMAVQVPSNARHKDLAGSMQHTKAGPSREPYQHQARESQRDIEEVQKSRSALDSKSGVRNNRVPFSSPTRLSKHSGLQRNFSESRGRSSQGARAEGSVLDSSRPSSRHDRNKGRVSPLKQLRRPSPLTSIPESFIPPKARTTVTFSIDANGRAKTETTLVIEDQKTNKGGPESAESDRDLFQSESSSDDEPILIPSQQTSFALPDKRVPRLAHFDTSISLAAPGRRNSGGAFSQSSGDLSSALPNDQDSEAETVLDDDGGAGDATIALREVVKSRHQKSKPGTRSQYLDDSTTLRRQRPSQYSLSTNISPTTVTDPDLATPSTDRESVRGNSTRCVCNKPGDGTFMIQCESCDKWQHARCVGISRDLLPPVWICAFCAQTPNVRGGRIRDAGRGAPTGTNSVSFGSSPLAHKSFKSFR